MIPINLFNGFSREHNEITGDFLVLKASSIRSNSGLAIKNQALLEVMKRCGFISGARR